MDTPVRLPPSWKNLLLREFQKPYMKALRSFLVRELRQGATIFPPASDFFHAFHAVGFERVKVVVLGQDPYHGRGQAHGLSFSVPPPIPPPPSLQNIFKELQDDVGIPAPSHGSLAAWARQGVLLLNATLTVRAGEAGSHQNKGWEMFTDRVIYLLNGKREHLVFMLWGSYAQRKGAFIDTEKHLVLKASHPSPFSARRGFFGCGHFSRANHYLGKHGIKPVDWRIPPVLPSPAGKVFPSAEHSAGPGAC